MPDKLRIGAVSYLNTRPLVLGLEEGLGAERIDLSYAAPSVLAERMLADELDVALLPVVELARMSDLELVPGLGIVTFGPSRSVLLVGKRPVDQVASVALDPESRTSNALARVLFATVWRRDPAFAEGSRALTDTLEQFDAAVRIGDKALFEPLPEGCFAHDLGTVWTEATGLPFVFAAWAARPGVVDRDLYRLLHASRRRGTSRIEQIAEEYRWQGERRPDVARAYLRENIRFCLGADEVRAMELFFRLARETGAVARAPRINLARMRLTDCPETAASGVTNRGAR